MAPLSRLALGCLMLVGLAACDSGNPIDPPTPADVAGTYDLADFRFRPAATALPVVVVSDTLVAADSFVELLDGGQALLRLRKRGGVTQVVTGTFEVRTAQVRVTFAPGSEATLATLLLPRTLTLDRTSAVQLDLASASAAYTADLNAYDPVRFSGFSAVQGALQIRLVRRGI